MAFENVNVASLRENINSCKQSISYATTVNLINDISDDNVWCFSSKEILKKALDTLCNTRYRALNDYLDRCLVIVGYIEQYKEEEEKIKDYQKQIANLSSKFNFAKSNCTTYKVGSGDSLWGIAQKFGVSMYDIADINGLGSINDFIYAGQRLVIPDSSNISYYKNQINSLKSKISQCRAEMESLESKVSNSIV